MTWHERLSRTLEGLFRSLRVLRPVMWTVFVLLVVWLVLTTPGATSFLKSSDWLIRLLQVALWPAVILLAVLLIFTTGSGTKLFSSLFGRLQKVSAFGVDLELTPEVA